MTINAKPHYATVEEASATPTPSYPEPNVNVADELSKRSALRDNLDESSDEEDEEGEESAQEDEIGDSTAPRWH